MFAARPTSAEYVQRHFKKHGLSARPPLLQISMTMEDGEKKLIWCAERQSWLHERHNVVYSDESVFYVQYSHGHIRI